MMIRVADRVCSAQLRFVPDANGIALQVGPMTIRAAAARSLELVVIEATEAERGALAGLGFVVEGERGVQQLGVASER